MVYLVFQLQIYVFYKNRQEILLYFCGFFSHPQFFLHGEIGVQLLLAGKMGAGAQPGHRLVPGEVSTRSIGLWRPLLNSIKYYRPLLLDVVLSL